MKEKYYSLTEASKQIPITRNTLYKWVTDNKISYTKYGNRFYLSQEQLNALAFVYTKVYTQATK